MINKKVLIMLGLLPLIVACKENNKDSSSKPASSLPSEEISSTESESSSSSSSSSSAPLLPTEALTEAMFAPLQKGFSVEYKTKKTYTDGGTGSEYRFQCEAGLDGYNYKRFYLKDAQYKPATIHYEKRKDPNDNLDYVYETSLSLDNTILANKLVLTDKNDFSEYNPEWDYSGFGVVFNELTVSDFTKVDDNTFSLNADKITDDISNSLLIQLYSADDFYLPSSNVKTFNLKTNGDQIVGFSLDCYPYVSSDSTTNYHSEGSFLSLGENSYKKITPYEGETKPELEEIFSSLRGEDNKSNYRMEQTQYAFDYNSESMKFLGTMEWTVQDGDKAYWLYRDPTGKKTSDYGYYKVTDEDEEGKQGVVKMGDYYYKDYIYQGTMQNYLPKFQMSSKLFEKDEAKSTNGKIVYNLNKNIEISLDNNSAFFTPEEMDSYRDRIIFLSVTKEGDTVTIRNSTDDSGKEEDGLILNCEFTDIGKVTGLFAENTLKDDASGLKWSDFLSRNEANSEAVKKVYGDSLDLAPTFGSFPVDIRTDFTNGSAASPLFYGMVYDESKAKEIITQTSTKYEEAGFTDETPADDETGSKVFSKTVTVPGRGSKTQEKKMTVTLSNYWNSIQKYGQIQASFKLTSLSSK